MVEFVLCDSLEKVLVDRKPKEMKEERLYLFKGERVSFSLAYRSADTSINGRYSYTVEVEAGRLGLRIRKAALVADTLPTLCFDDDAYLFTRPSVVPDRLDEYTGSFKPLYDQWRSLYIDLFSKGEEQGLVPVTVRVKDEKGETVFEKKIDVLCSDKKIPSCPAAHTEWIYVDCLADYYQDEVFGEENWKCIENNLICLHDEAGVNMLYTPLLTPALDTKIGLERTTCQLVDIRVEKGEYSFDFSKLARWCTLARRIGFEYIELSHLFTQWGAKASPKVVATVDGEEKRIFGWDTVATGDEYINFLSLLIPQTKEVLHSFGYDDEHIYFHISDEPEEEQLEQYMAAKAKVQDIIGDCPIFDAMSNYRFYSEGVAKLPAVAADRIDGFIEKGASPLWVYYCIAQIRKVPNRFMALPLYRARVLGILMYVYDIKGFLHWGYNFYNTEFSLRKINPYAETDSGEAFASGDAYLVYPGVERKPVPSLRLEATRQAFEDYAKLSALEGEKGREYVLDLVRKGNGGVLPTFLDYPQCSEFITELMNKVCEELA